MDEFHGVRLECIFQDRLIHGGRGLGCSFGGWVKRGGLDCGGSMKSERQV